VYNGLHRIIENPPLVSDASFARAERELGVVFPEDYREIVRQYQGALPLPNDIEHPDASTAVEYLYHFEDKPCSASILGATYFNGLTVPTDVIPFAAGIGGDYFCFDFRTDPKNPIVVVHLHDNQAAGLIKLADSFTQWLELLSD